MSDLPTPITRKEQFLNSIARGNTSDLPTPITREEEYLNAIAKSGGGSGDGDMKKSVYDSDLAVANAGGIGAFVGNAVSGKVDKVEGKGLSTNDYSDTEKGKVAANTTAIEAIENVTGAKNLFDFDDYLKTANPASGYTKNGNSYTVNDFSELHDVTAYQFSEDDIDGIFTVILSTTESSNAPQPAFWIYDKNGNLVSTENIPERLPTNTPYEWSQSFNGGCKIVVKQYAGTGHLTFTSPMIRDARITDPTYAPYAMTNRELTERVKPLTSRTRNNITSRISYLLTAISEQNLEKYGYTIGDYFTGSSGYTYHLADMDTFYGGYSSYAVVSTHHAGVVVDTHETSAWMDGVVTTYGASTLHSYLSGTALDKIKADMIALFGGSTGLEHLIANYKLFGGVGTWGWSSGAEYISALTECQMYGCPIWSCDEYQQGEAIKKLTLFDKYCPNEIYGNMWVWLRSLYGSSVACFLDTGGAAGNRSVTGAGRASGLILLH